MRTTLVMFAVLLLVLTLLSTFGGSITPREPFFEDTEPTVPPSNVQVPQMTSANGAEPSQPIMASEQQQEEEDKNIGIPEPFEGEDEYDEEFASFNPNGDQKEEFRFRSRSWRLR